jgi:adenylate cyclase class 2
MIEVEWKGELLPGSWLILHEQLATMRFTHQIRNIDIYYDTEDFDLLRQAVFVRVRNQQNLEFKFNEQAAPAHISCYEYSFLLEPEPTQVNEMNELFHRFVPRWHPAATVEKALSLNHMVPLAHIENRRAHYSDQDLSISVDQVAGLGDFVEIEIPCAEKSEVPHAEERVQSIGAKLVARHVRVGYVELWLKKYHPQAYQLGKYQV